MAGAGFGFVKPQATSVRANDLPGFKDLSWGDRLMMIGSAMRGDMETARSIPLMAAARARQAAMAGLDQEFSRYMTGEGVPTLARSERPAVVEEAPPMRSGLETGVAAAMGQGELGDVPMRPKVNVSVPSFDVIPGERRQGPPTVRDAIPLLMRRKAAGIDISKDLELLDKAGPDYEYINGVRVDMRDPNAPAEIGEIEKGQVRAYDSAGRPIGVITASGYLKSIAEIEAAKTEATERAKAGYDVGTYEDADGIPRRMTRRQAADSLNGVPMGGDRAPVPGGAPRAPAGLPDISRGQSAADKVRAEGRAKTDVEIEALTPKARSTLDTLDRKTDFVLNALRKAAQQSTGGLGGAAGVNALMSGMPETAAYDLRSTLDTIEAAVGFDELQQMRDNSPTGGAVGNLTERELSLLASLRGSLKQGQSPEQLRANITRMIGEIEKVRAERKAAFERQYGSGRRAAAPAARITPEQARAELARRRAERGQ